ncbi:hypothetical protein P9112_007503 [Eukaryota sp. TZLM1-RC]
MTIPDNLPFTQQELYGFMDLAVKEAASNERLREGGPFGAAVVNVNTREVVSSAHNEVLARHDPSAHAEVMAIRYACQKLQRHILDDCILVTSAYCCPMCLSAVFWARIPTVFFASDVEEADRKGFDDLVFYEELRRERPTKVQMHRLIHNDAKKVFDDSTTELY